MYVKDLAQCQAQNKWLLYSLYTGSYAPNVAWESQEKPHRADIICIQTRRVNMAA